MVKSYRELRKTVALFLYKQSRDPLLKILKRVALSDQSCLKQNYRAGKSNRESESGVK